MSNSVVPAAPRPRRFLRFLTLTIVSLLIGAGAGTGVFFLQHDEYQSTATVHIRPVISPLLGQPTVMPMYDSFVSTQIGFIKSQRCLDLALVSPQWRGPGHKGNEEVRAEFAKRLMVVRDGEFIHVTYADVDSRTAMDAVAAIMTAYQELEHEIDPDNAAKSRQRLESIKSGYEQDLADSRKRMTEVAAPYKVNSLKTRYAYLADEALQAETELRASRRELEAWKISNPPTDSPPATNPALTRLQAKVDLDEARLAALTLEVDELERKMNQINQIEHGVATTSAWLDQTIQKLEELRLNSNSSGLILIVSAGDTPVPYYRHRITIASIVAGGTFLLSLLATSVLFRRKPAPAA